MDETTHDSSSSSRKSEEKCPPAGGIKMKVGGFKDGHCYNKPSDAAIQVSCHSHLDSQGDWTSLHSDNSFVTFISHFTWIYLGFTQAINDVQP